MLGIFFRKLQFEIISTFCPQILFVVRNFDFFLNFTYTIVISVIKWVYLPNFVKSYHFCKIWQQIVDL